MNCKQGDLVRYVGSNPYNRPNVYGWIGLIVCSIADRNGDKCWVVNPPLPGGIVKNSDSSWSDGTWLFDSSCKPIRDNPGQDETLQWAPVPKKETA